MGTWAAAGHIHEDTHTTHHTHRTQQTFEIWQQDCKDSAQPSSALARLHGSWQKSPFRPAFVEGSTYLLWPHPPRLLSARGSSSHTLSHPLLCSSMDALYTL